jgi:hypothetical protein
MTWSEAQRRDRLSHDAEGVDDAISSAFMRKPVAPQKPYDEAGALEQRAQMQDRTRAIATQQAAARKAAELDDPTSESSRTMQGLFAKLHPDAAKEIGDAGSKLSYTKLLQIAPHLASYETTRAGREAKAAAAAAKAAEEAKKDQVRQDTIDRQEHDRIRARGWQEGDKNEARSFAEQQGEKTRAAQIRAAEIAAGAHKLEHETDKSDEAIKDLGKQLPADAGGFFEQSKQLRQLISKHPGDIPGVGFVEGRLPFSLQSPEGLAAQKYARQMQLAYRKLITGTGGGEKEMAEIEKAGLDLTNEKSFLAGLKALEEGYTARLQQVKAGYPEQVVKTYESRVPSLRSPAAAPKPTGRSKTDRDGVVWEEMSDGSARRQP